MWGGGGCGGGGTPPDICFSRSLNEHSRSQNICGFYSRTTKYFRLITRDNHPANFGCINASRESVY